MVTYFVTHSLSLDFILSFLKKIPYFVSKHFTRRASDVTSIIIIVHVIGGYRINCELGTGRNGSLLARGAPYDMPGTDRIGSTAGRRSLRCYTRYCYLHAMSKLPY